MKIAILLLILYLISTGCATFHEWKPDRNSKCYAIVGLFTTSMSCVVDKYDN